MADKHSRKRRLVRAIMLTLLTPLLLLAGYVSTWIAVSKAARENLISSNTALNLRPAFAPLIRFSDTQYPGGVGLNRLWWGINPRKVVTNGNVRTEYATSALALAPPDLERRAEMGDPRSYPQPVAQPQPVAHDASAMRR